MYKTTFLTAGRLPLTVAFDWKSRGPEYRYAWIGVAGMFFDEAMTRPIPDELVREMTEEAKQELMVFIDDAMQAQRPSAEEEAENDKDCAKLRENNADWPEWLETKSHILKDSPEDQTVH